eukprot:GFKZ01003525.1.p1 GENE.GFKZ01003525.1~~GFKZ01003525.1.p1  ORF type:complete len:201 (-),score=16.12 GFKZ01003525.1:987-1553(-)
MHAPKLQRSPAMRPLSRTFHVKTEFIYQPPPNSPPPKHVTLHGTWDNFCPHQLHPESPTLFSQILIIPTGAHQFYFHVDSIRRLSHLHPVSPCGKLNVRRVTAPAKQTPRGGTSGAFVRWAEERLAGCGVVAEDQPIGDATPLPVLCEQYRAGGGRAALWNMCWMERVIVVAAAYLVVAAVVALVGGK